MESLSHLDLSENRISTGLEALTSCPNLKYINLSGNRIAEWAAVEPLKKLEQLKSLDLFGNEIAVDMEYRRQIFEVIIFSTKINIIRTGIHRRIQGGLLRGEGRGSDDYDVNDIAISTAT
ncbi:unnamed protein product [Gongylonema pulchrum]|uniref:Uncharacterized protein n=1 Tax=Gongylonema pulchrum TaxID=637853 RepID=A0A3P6RUI2_9BILA|nr:unnamed protein product [Gongylonema pulchrum]